MLSLQQKLQSLLVFIGLVGFAFVATLSYQGLNVANESKTQLVETAASTISDKVDRNLFECYGDVQAFALSEPAVSGDARRISDFIDDMMGTYAPIYDAMLVLVSSRPEDYRRQTTDWLAQNEMKFDNLIMRQSGDKRPDTEVKNDIYHRYLKHYNIVRVFDDRPSVIRMWREKGLEVQDVGDGVEF